MFAKLAWFYARKQLCKKIVIACIIYLKYCVFYFYLSVPLMNQLFKS